MASRKLQTLSLTVKFEILCKIEQGKKQSEIAKEYGIPRTTVTTFVRNKEKILSAFQSCAEPSRKRLRTSDFKDVENATLLWLRSARKNLVPLSGAILQEKARQFAKALGQNEFQGSTGWLARFKKRHRIVFKSVCGEKGAALSNEAVKEWKQNVLQDAMRGYNERDIFNCDEMALFYRALPNKTLAFKGEVCTGGKHSKERLTALLCANMDGTEKLKPLVIGKSKNPRCFRGVKFLPVDYESNGKAWMTSLLFERWLHKLDQRFNAENRKVLMILDNCTAHSICVENLRAIKLCFLPTNATSVLQPLDQGVIKNVKAFYRKYLVTKFLELGVHVSNVKISILQAVEILDLAWKSVTSTTIVNCFKCAGFGMEEAVEGAVMEDGTHDAFDISDVDLGNVSWGEFCAMDDDVATSGDLDDEQILDTVKGKNSEMDDDESDREVDVQNPPSRSETFAAVETVRRYLRSQDNAENAISSLNCVEEFLFSVRKYRQRTMEEFLQ